MKRPQSPQEKKALAYRKDHVVWAEYPHAFRRYWPRKRAAANRAYRHRVRQILHDVRDLADTDEDRAPDVRAAEVRRREVRKWGKPGAWPLADVVSYRQELRTDRTAWNFFRDEYESARDRKRFAVFLTAITAGTTSTPHTVRLARFLGEILDAPAGRALDRQVFQGLERRRMWLRAFLRDAPEWEPRLRSWVARVLEGER